MGFMMFWITPYLGTSDYLTSVFIEPGAIIFDVRDLIDGTNPPKIVADKLLALIGTVHHNEKVVVRCKGGMSRSPAMVAGFLSWFWYVDYWDALNEVKKKNPMANPNPDMNESVIKALAMINNDMSEAEIMGIEEGLKALRTEGSKPFVPLEDDEV